MVKRKVRIRTDVEEIVSGLGYNLLDQYNEKGKNKRVFIEDNKGYKYEIDFFSLFSGHLPNFVDKRNPYSLNNIFLWLQLNDKNFELSNENIYIGNKEKLKFHCYKCGEYFYMAWAEVYHGQSCPICCGQQVGDKNNLKYLCPDIAEEWSDKNEVSSSDITPYSHMKFWWKCSRCGWEWIAVVCNRTMGCGCPACAGKVVTDKNRLSITYPEIAKEWHPNKNGKLTPHDVSYGVSNKKYWWICPKGHEWMAKINNRTSNNREGCPICASLYLESAIATELKKYYKEKHFAETEYKILKNNETNRWLYYDIYIWGGKDKLINGTYIEVHGDQHYKINLWHKLLASRNNRTINEEFKYRKKLDSIKKKYAKKNGTYIEVDLRKIKTTEQAIKYIDERIEGLIK